MSDRLLAKKSCPGEVIYDSEVYCLAPRILSTLPFGSTPQSPVLSVQTQLDSQLVPVFPSRVNGTSESPPPPYSSCPTVAHFHTQRLSNASARETSALILSLSTPARPTLNARSLPLSTANNHHGTNSFTHRRLGCPRAASLSSFPALQSTRGSSPSSYHLHRTITQPLLNLLGGNSLNTSIFASSASTVQDVHVDVYGANDGQSAQGLDLTIDGPVEVDAEGLFRIYPHRELCRSPAFLEGPDLEEDQQQYREQELHRCQTNWRDMPYWDGRPASPSALKDGEVDDNEQAEVGIGDVNDIDPEHEGHPNSSTAIWPPVSEFVREQQDLLNVTCSPNPPLNQRAFEQSGTSIDSLPSLSRYRTAAEAQANDFDRILAELEWIGQEAQEIYPRRTHSEKSSCSPHTSTHSPTPATVPTPITVDGFKSTIGQSSHDRVVSLANHSSSSSCPSSSYAQTSPMLPLRSPRFPVFARSHLDSGICVLNARSRNGVMNTDIIAPAPRSGKTKVNTHRRMPFRRTIGGGGRAKAKGLSHASAMAAAGDTDDILTSVELTPPLTIHNCEGVLMNVGIAPEPEAAHIPFSAALATELNFAPPDFYTTSAHNVRITSHPYSPAQLLSRDLRSSSMGPFVGSPGFQDKQACLSFLPSQLSDNAIRGDPATTFGIKDDLIPLVVIDQSQHRAGNAGKEPIMIVNTTDGYLFSSSTTPTHATTTTNPRYLHTPSAKIYRPYAIVPGDVRGERTTTHKQEGWGLQSHSQDLWLRSPHEELLPLPTIDLRPMGLSTVPQTSLLHHGAHLERRSGTPSSKLPLPKQLSSKKAFAPLPLCAEGEQEAPHVHLQGRPKLIWKESIEMLPPESENEVVGLSLTTAAVSSAQSSPSISGNVRKFKFDPFARTPRGSLDIVTGEQSHGRLPTANTIIPSGQRVLPSNMERKQHSVFGARQPPIGRQVSLNTYARRAQMRWMQEQQTEKSRGLEAPIYAREITQSPEPMELSPFRHSIIVETPNDPKPNALQSTLLGARRSLWGQYEGFRHIIQGLAGGSSIMDGHLDQQGRPGVANHQLTLTDSDPVPRMDLPFVEERTKQHLIFPRLSRLSPSPASRKDSDACGEMKILAAPMTLLTPEATFLGEASHTSRESSPFSPPVTGVFLAGKPSTSRCVPTTTSKPPLVTNPKHRESAHKHRNKLLAQRRFHRCVVDPVEDVLVACTPGFVPRWGFA